MRIKRANFRFNRLVNVDDIIGHSNLLLMEQEDIMLIIMFTTAF